MKSEIISKDLNKNYQGDSKMFSYDCSAESISKILFIKEIFELVIEQAGMSGESLSWIESMIGIEGIKKIVEIKKDIESFKEGIDTRNS